MNRQFSALGGLAMILIVLNHAIELGLGYPERLGFASPPEWFHNTMLIVQGLGVFAVPTFLFISGSFLAYAAQGEPPRLTPKFLASSLRNILIPYVIWSVVFFILVYFHWSQGYTLMGYLKHLVTGYPFHFIPLLVFFYVLSPLMVIPAKRYPVLLLLVFLIYQFLLIVILNPNIFGFQFPGWMNRLAVPALKTTMSEWGLYFPFGLVYGLHVSKIQPLLRKYAWLSASMTVLLFILAILSGFKLILLPAARYLIMLSFVLFIPAIRRDQIPFLPFFERVGKMTYGLYLTHLICIDLFVILIQLVYPQFLGWSWILILSMFLVGISTPIALMEGFSKGRMRKIYRYLFG